MAYLSQEQLEAMNFKRLGKYVKISDKASVYNVDQLEIGDNSRIDDFCVVSGKIVIGAFVHISPFCLLAGGTEGIIIGDFSSVSYGSQIFSQSDDYSGQHMTGPLVPAEYTSVRKAQVILGRHTMVGASAVVFPGVHLAEGCSIGAMSLVTKSTEPWGVYVGVPVTRVKEKSRGILALEEQFACEHLSS